MALGGRGGKGRKILIFVPGFSSFGRTAAAFVRGQNFPLAIDR